MSGYTDQEQPAYASISTMQLAGKSVAILGVNSAWMCSRNKDRDGEVDDRGRLVVGEPQIHDALNQIAPHDLRIVVVHHPFDWLADFDRNRIEDRLERGAHFILCGHQHVPKVRIVSGTGGECVTIPAGAAYDRRVAPDPRYTNAYNFVRLDLNAGRGVVHLRRWSDPRNEWIEDTDASPGGRYEFRLPGRKSGKPGRRPARPSTSGGSRAKDERVDAAARRYRDMLLESCDIIDLANLPEQDRHLAHRQLELRRLYVPLRVRVEAKAEEVAAEKVWDALETRRAAAWRGGASPEERSAAKRIAVGERLAEARRLVVLGDPGAGKTTLTRWIATAYLLKLKSDPEWRDLPDVQTLPSADWLPVLVRCRDLDATCLGGSLNAMLRHTLRKAELSEGEADDVHKFLWKKICAGQALLILDGLDEITDPSVRARFCRQVEAVVSAHQDLPIIATSRIVGYREMGSRLGRGFEHLTLADLTREDKDAFARRWSELTERPERRDAAARELIADIHSSDRVERLTGNPMLLTTMALVKRKVGKLPQRRADLYWEAVQVLLNWRREVDEPLDHREAVPQLEYLAYAMCDRGVQRLREDEVIELITQMREEFPNVHSARERTPEAFLHLLEARTGILIQAGNLRHLGRPVPVYEFRHLTFQEYLAARALVDGRFPGRDARHSLADNVTPLAGRTSDVGHGGRAEETVVESWREALRLCVAICNDDDVDAVLRAISTLQPGEAPAVGRARAVQATLCLADEPNASEDVGREIVRALAAQVDERDGGGHPDASGVNRAAIELAGTRWAPALSGSLLAEYFQRDAQPRTNPGGLSGMVASAIAPQDDAGLEVWLGDQVRRLRDGDEHSAAEAALGVMQAVYEGRWRLIPGLVDALLVRLDGSAPMAHAAAWALGWLNDAFRIRERSEPWNPTPAEISVMVAFVRKPTSDPEAVRWLARIFHNAKTDAAVESLAFWLGSNYAATREAAAAALGKIGGERAAEALTARLEDEDAAMRRTAAAALGEIGSERAVEALTARLEDEDASVRRTAAAALGKIGGERAAEALTARLEDEDAAMRRTAAAALGEIGSERAVEALTARLEDEDASVRRTAAAALGEIGSERAVEALTARLEDEDASVRRTAAAALGKIGGERAVEALTARLEDEDADVRQSAAAALGKIGGERAVEALTARLEDEDAAMRRTAAAALGEIGSERAVEALTARLEDEDASVRRTAAAALGEIGSERAVEALTARLEDEDASVRRTAAAALGKIGGERAVEALTARLEDEDADVRQSAAAALGKSGGERAVEALTARLEDEDADVRRAALGSLARRLDDVDRRLLTRDLDGFDAFLDPREQFSRAQIDGAALKLNLSVDEVRTRYEALAGGFGLRLESAAE